MLTFNRNPVEPGLCVPVPSEETVRNTFGLHRASLRDAAFYGGEFVQAALSTLSLRHTRQHILVDVKVHMLMQGMNPAIPSWHTDGVPRPSKHEPDIQQQLFEKSPVYHLIVSSGVSATEFLSDPLELDLTAVNRTANLYAEMDKQVRALQPASFAIEPCRWFTWDWWNIHRGVPASESGWRVLIRVTESDTPPETDLRKIIRVQQQVYVEQSYGW